MVWPSCGRTECGELAACKNCVYWDLSEASRLGVAGGLCKNERSTVDSSHSSHVCRQRKLIKCVKI